MDNPWLSIPLDEYEQHMAHPAVAQDVLLASVLEDAVRRHAPLSLAVIGCAGGNGFERLPAFALERVVALDINPEYVRVLRERFSSTFPKLETIAGDIQIESVTFAPVNLIVAGLLLEYVDPERALSRLQKLLRPDGILTTVIQLPGAQTEITPTPYSTLNRLEGYMRLVPPERLIQTAKNCGLKMVASSRLRSATGKAFQLLEFRKSAE